MAGSKRYFRYRSDSGTDFSIQLDESNSEATTGTTKLMPARTAAHALFSKASNMRYALANTTAPVSVAAATSGKVVQRKFWVGDPAAFALLQVSGATISCPVYPGGAAATWAVTATRGEKSKIAPALNATAGDTGLDDADQGLDQA